MPIIFYEFNGHRPTVDPSSFVHPQAAVTGDVIIGKNVYIGPFAAIRGDWGRIVIEDGCNVQESCTIHLFPGAIVHLKAGTHLGHGAIVHGATIGRNCLLGMHSVIMDNVVIEDECIIGALSFVKAETHVPIRSLVVGNPARIVKRVSDEMLQWKTQGTAIYQRLPQDMRENWKPCEPLLPGDGALSGDGGSPRESASIADERFAPNNYRPWTQTPVNEPAAGRGRGGVRVDHNVIQLNLVMTIGPKLNGTLCHLFTGDLGVEIEAEGPPANPDLTIVCGEPRFRDDNHTVLINPGVIIEIRSPATKNDDRGDKFRFYHSRPTFREYVLVDSQSVLVEHFTKTEQGWTLEKYDQLSDTFRIGLPGIDVSLRDIYRKVMFPSVPR